MRGRFRKEQIKMAKWYEMGTDAQRHTDALAYARHAVGILENGVYPRKGFQPGEMNGHDLDALHEAANNLLALARQLRKEYRAS